ncbi:MAG: phosphate acetyltransferase [Pseudomonadota bacterium]
MRTLLLLPTTVGVGLTALAKGLLCACDYRNIKALRYQPISHHDSTEPYHYHHSEAETMVRHGKMDDLLDTVINGCDHFGKDVDIIIVQGLLLDRNYSFAQSLNAEIAKALNADVIFAAAPTSTVVEDFIDQIANNLAVYRDDYQLKNYAGVIINKFNPPFDAQGNLVLDISAENNEEAGKLFLQDFKANYQHTATRLPVLGVIPWDKKLLMPRVVDIAHFLQAEMINAGEVKQRRIARITLCARNIANIIYTLQADSLIVTPADRSDIIIAACLAALSGIRIAGILLTSYVNIADDMKKLCEQALHSGLPILATPEDSFRTALKLKNLYFHVAEDDQERLEMSKAFIAEHIDSDWIETLSSQQNQQRCSPAAFRHQIMHLACQAKKTIILPEGNDPRIIQAAILCAERGIARFKILGKVEEVTRLAENVGLSLHDDIEIIDPDVIRDHYVAPLVKLRAHKGVIEPVAQVYLKDNIFLAIMMLYQNEVDGLVAGAVNTTANTIRPALQIIKTRPDSKLVSSVFFMCMPEQVLVFGDCAINPDPDAEQLAEIAIQSAETARHFGITPVIAMLSYSTGSSAGGADVEKVKKATAIVREQCPELSIDGPLQYDAALIESVARKKAPDSHVAGRANVLIFPDLNTGNTTYKAVQRSANILSIGPILQGLNRPVNDLSRGATVNDIVYTIVITAVQANNNPSIG